MLAVDDCIGHVISVLVLSDLEPLMLNDTGPRGLAVSVVDCGIALEVGR